jgi:hypothetical protein
MGPVIFLNWPGVLKLPVALKGPAFLGSHAADYLEKAMDRCRLPLVGPLLFAFLTSTAFSVMLQFADAVF